MQVQILVEVAAGAGVPAFDAEGQELLRRAKAAWDEDLSRHKGRKVHAMLGCARFGRCLMGSCLARSFFADKHSR